MPVDRRSFIQRLSSLAVVPALCGFIPTDERFAASDTHRVLSCNIRVALDDDELKGVGWSTRRQICLQIIEKQKPDIICLQEVLRVQAEDFRKHFTRHQLFGFEGPEMDEHKTGYHGIAKNPIIFSKDKYELLTGGTYWLSETPLVAGSKSWDTARARHVIWVRLLDKVTRKEFRVVNLHLDHVSALAQTEQLKLVVSESGQYLRHFPQILAGDFNTRFDNAVLHSVRGAKWHESYETLHGNKEAGFTGHAFQGVDYSKSTSGRIDYIWYRGAITPSESSIIKDAVNGVYPSDHYFLKTDFRLD